MIIQCLITLKFLLLKFQLVPVLRALEKGGTIRELNLSLISGGYGGDRVAELVCRVIPNCRSVQLRSVAFMFEYGWKQLFTALSDAVLPSLEEFDISKNNLSDHVSSAAALASAVVKIVRVKLMETKLTALQSSSIFERISRGGERIEDLDIMFNNLSHLDPDHLAQAATKLVRLNLGWTKLNERQLERMFERLDWQQKKVRKLRELKLSGVDLSCLDRRLLARVVSRRDF